MPYAPSTQSESSLRLLARSIRLYRAAFFRVIGIALLLAIISFTPRIIALMTGKNIFDAMPQFSPEKLWLLLSDLVCFILFTVILWRIRCVMEREHESLAEDLFISLKKMPRIIGAALVETGIVISLYLMSVGLLHVLREQDLVMGTDKFHILLSMTPLLGQIVLNVFIVVLLMFYLPLILTENKHIFEALGKSAALVWGNWWRTFAIQIIPWLTYGLTLVLLQYVLHVNIRFYYLNITDLTITGTVIHILVFMLFLPWSATTLMVQLRDLEIKRKNAGNKAV